MINLVLDSKNMKFDVLDKKMRVFEENLDQVVLPDVFMVIRLDGRGFTRLTKELLPLERPFDERFRNAMISTTTHLMDCGFKVNYGYTQSDEISLLLDKGESAFGRKTRKLISIMAGEASANFTHAMGTQGVFDCRIIPLPTDDLVIDYFRWRGEDAHRNSLSAWCYWTLRKNGGSVSEATRALQGLSVADKNEILFQHGINYNDLPTWQKRGVGFCYRTEASSAINPATQQPVVVVRRKLQVQMELPLGVAYESMLRGALTDSGEDPLA
jgi:tRNA(His) guanylyltransferase